MANKYILILMLLSAVAPAWAQTGPGGVSATGTTTNLKLWLSSDRGVFTNAGTTPATNAQSVQQWNDFSGNATNATNANTASTRPTFVATAGNGRPALNFTPGSLQTLTAGLDIRPSVQPQITVIAVSRTAQTTSTPLAKLWGHDAPVAGSGFHRGIGFDNRATTAFTYFSGAGVGSYGTVPANADFITSSNYTATTFNGFINGSQIVSNASVSQNGGATALSIGSLTPNSEFWNGTLSEFIVFNKSLSDAERRLVESYLAAKYAITITNDVYAMDEPANGNFDFDVAGIGAESTGASVTSAQGSGILGVSVATAPVAGRYFVYGHDNGPLALAGSNQPPGTSSRLARIWAASELNGDVGSMNLSFDVSGIPGVPQTGFSDYRLIIDRNGNGSFSDESAATAGVIPASSRTGNVINFNGVNIGNAQRFTLAFTNTVALPLDLLSFRAAATGAQNKISWETANVRGVAGLELERSADGVNFGLLERVSVNETGRYSISDTRPEATSYYRLRIVDADGASSYGAIEKVLRGSLQDVVRIVPNPASDAITISGLPAATATIRIIDAMGRVLTTTRSSGASANISLAAYAPGIYFVRIDGAGLQVAERISIVR